jgi:hypothetical protein
MNLDLRTLGAAALMAFLALGSVAGGAAPLLPRRPPELAGPKSEPSPRSSGAAEQERPAASEMEACLARLASLGVDFETVAAPTTETLACTVAIPIRLKRIGPRRGDGTAPIEFPARPLVDCRLAEPLALWLAGAVAPILAAGFSSRLTAVRTGPGYECRNRNRAAAGKISAHALGLALDISGFELADGRSVPAATPKDEPGSALNSLRTAACGWFMTVLGPGSDPAHEDHLHVDVEPHGASGRYRICD